MDRWYFAALTLFAGGAALAQPPAGGAKPAQGDTELHVVCAYEGYTKTGDMIHGGRAVVKVDRPGKTVTLVVSAYNPITWDVVVAPGTTLKKVIVAGYHRQAVKGQLKGVEVIEAFHEKREGKESLYAYFYCIPALTRYKRFCSNPFWHERHSWGTRHGTTLRNAVEGDVGPSPSPV